jgi:hypothetical protein
MNRLTCNGQAEICKQEIEAQLKEHGEAHPKHLRYVKLAAYEDRGLEPEELQEFMKRIDLKDLHDHISELLELEKQGLLKKFPYRIGDTVYWLSPFKTGINFGEILAIKMSKFGFDLEIKTTGNVIRKEFEKVFLTKEEAQKAMEGENGI